MPVLSVTRTRAPPPRFARLMRRFRSLAQERKRDLLVSEDGAFRAKRTAGARPRRWIRVGRKFFQLETALTNNQVISFDLFRRAVEGHLKPLHQQLLIHQIELFLGGTFRNESFDGVQRGVDPVWPLNLIGRDAVCDRDQNAEARLMRKVHGVRSARPSSYRSTPASPGNGLHRPCLESVRPLSD